LAYLTTEGRLGDVQLLRCSAEIEAFRNRDKVSNVTEFHGQLFYTHWVCFQHGFPFCGTIPETWCATKTGTGQ